MKKIARWILLLHEYEFDIVEKSRNKHINVEFDIVERHEGIGSSHDDDYFSNANFFLWRQFQMSTLIFIIT